jgi:flagellar motor switch protein FliG
MNSINGEDKVAWLLRSLDAKAAAEVVEQLEGSRKSRIRGLMQQHTQDSPNAELLEQFVRDLSRVAAAPNGAASLRVVHADDAPPKAGARPPEPAMPADNSGDVIAQLRAMDQDRLFMGLEGEHPQTVATVINCLEPEPAGDLLKRLSPEARRLVFLRLGQSGGPIDLVPRIVQAIVRKCQALAESPIAEKSDVKYQRMAEVLKRLERTDRMELLVALNAQDSETAAMVKDRLYTFDDLRTIDDRSVQKLLTEIDSKTLAMALKGVEEEISEKVLNNLSKRGREMVLEEMSFLGHLPAAQIHQAQKAVVAVIQTLDQAGELVMIEVS